MMTGTKGNSGGKRDGAGRPTLIEQFQTAVENGAKGIVGRVETYPAMGKIQRIQSYLLGIEPAQRRLTSHAPDAATA
jgi:hypothetical protein